MNSPPQGRISCPKFLYRRFSRAVITILGCFLFAIPASAQRPQLKRPEEAPPEKPAEPAPKKLVNEPRAVGLLQLNTTGKGTLIPIAIRIDGRFYDASVYKADPVPMALDVGTVYEVEKDGESQGLFTIGGALHNQNPNSSTPWLGAGAYVVNGSEPAQTVHIAESTPRGLDSDTDAPPRLTRGKESGAAAGQSSASGSAGAATNTNAGTPSTTAGSSSNGAGQQSSKTSNGNTQAQTAPVSAKQNSSKPDSTQAPAAPATQASPKPDSANSGAASPSSQSSPASPQAQNQNSTGGSSASYYRPTLRRGKPTESAPADTPDELTRTTEAAGSPNTGTSSTVPAPAAKPPIQLVPAISDAGGPLPQTYKFFWKEGEEDDRRKQMLDLAANEVRAYLAMLAKDTIPANPAVKSASANAAKKNGAGRKSTEKIDPTFENVQFRAFDVWKNNQPVMILTAEAHLPQTKAGTALPATYYITLAARTDIYGDLRKLYSGVTDRFHLDVTPRLELIDAVDADGDGRGELLFREATDAGSGYIIYRPTADTLWKMFDSLKE